MASERPPLASVREVREELRRLGYLDSGLDRFVLSGAGSASAWKASFRTALRLGALGGVLLGPCLALAAAGLEQGLLVEPTDFGILTFYLMIASALATALTGLAGGLAAAWAGRRFGRRPGPALSRNIGLGMGFVGMGYLALWWYSHARGSSLTAQAIVLCVGVALSFVLGRLGSLAAVAVLAAGRGEGLPEARPSRHRLRVLLAVIALFVSSGIVAASYLSGRDVGVAPDFAVLPTGLHLLVLGIDGFEHDMLEQRLRAGEMPHLKALLQRSAWGPLRAEPERVPALVWTTIATGRGPEAHLIRSTGGRRLLGMRRPVAVGGEGPFFRGLAATADLLKITRRQPPSSALRGAKTFWGVASEKGLRVGIVNWWATWPADPVNGYIVSDRTLFKLDRGGALDREIYPAGLVDELRRLLPRNDEEPARRLDRFYFGSARALRRGGGPDIAAIYLPGLDILTMQLLGDPGLGLATLDQSLEAVHAYHRFLDGLIGEVADDLKDSDMLILVGDPGRLARRANEASQGFLALAGARISPRRLGSVSERDVAPTILHLAGLPKSAELEGRVLEEALEGDFRVKHPVRFVASYGGRPRALRAESAFDRETLEQLKSLGYIQ